MSHRSSSITSLFQDLLTSLYKLSDIFQRFQPLFLNILMTSYFSGVAYVTDNLKGNCSTIPIESTTFDVRFTDPSHVRIRNTKEFFYFDRSNYIYEGQVSVGCVLYFLQVSLNIIDLYRFSFVPGSAHLHSATLISYWSKCLAVIIQFINFILSVRTGDISIVVFMSQHIFYHPKKIEQI